MGHLCLGELFRGPRNRSPAGAYHVGGVHAWPEPPDRSALADVHPRRLVPSVPPGTRSDRCRFRSLMWSDLIPLLRCPSCAASMLAGKGVDGVSATVTCAACGFQVPVRDGIPRFVDAPED